LRPTICFSASAFTILERSSTTPFTKPLARSRARSGESAIAVTATMLLCATVEPEIVLDRLCHVEVVDELRGGLDVAGRVARLPDDGQAVERGVLAAGGDDQQVGLGLVLLRRHR
jgi:hypothetical protein